MTAGNDKKELRKGEKLVVTIQEVLHNTILVYLEYRKVKFSGVLLNTTNRRGPYGIAEKPSESYCRAYGIDPAEIAAQEKVETVKAKEISMPRFPLAIETRTTYAQKLDLPPARQIYQRRRRSKRKVRMDMMDTDLAFRLMNTVSNRRRLAHSESCCCDRCTEASSDEPTDEKSVKEGKRKLLPDAKKVESKQKDVTCHDADKPLSKDSKRLKLDVPVKTDIETRSQMKGTKVVAKVSTSDTPDTPVSIKRSPVIKISYKSPGGKGQVLKIPSRVHSPTSMVSDPKKKAMHERARKVIIRAKSEHYKYLKDRSSNIGNKTEKPLDSRLADSKSKHLRVIGKDSGGAISKNNDTPAKNLTGTSEISKTSSSQIAMHSAAKVPHPRTSNSPGGKDSLVNGSRESPNNKSRRSLRSLTPQVLLQPLDSESGAEDNNSQKSDPSLAPATQSAKSPKTESSGGDDPASSSSDKRKDLSKLSHTISVTRCTTKEGVKWCQGDVVWGKIRGFPWWPGILRRIVVKKGPNSIEQVAIVDWFQSKTVSHIPCVNLESFSGNYKKRYSKKLKGNYKKAIQEAHEAEKKMSREVRKLIMQFET